MIHKHGAVIASSVLVVSASAQSIYLTASNDLPANGEAITIDVVLDATDYGGSFFAWHQYNFNIGMSSDADGSGLGAAVGATLAESNPLETAATQSSSGTLGTDAWVGGRRPGAFPGSSSNNGGSRFGPNKADLISNSGLSSTAGTIGGRQQAFTTPENNTLIHIGRVYEAFRFQFTYLESMGVVYFNLSDIVLNLYPNNASAGNEFVQPTFVGNFIIGPTPGSIAPLALMGFAATRRRRSH